MTNVLRGNHASVNYDTRVDPHTFAFDPTDGYDYIVVLTWALDGHNIIGAWFGSDELFSIEDHIHTYNNHVAIHGGFVSVTTSQTITVNYDDTARGRHTAFCLKNVHRSQPVRQSNGSAANGTSASVSLSDVRDKSLSVVAIELNNNIAMTPSADTTELADARLYGIDNRYFWGENTVGGNLSLGASWVSSERYAIAAVEFQPRGNKFKMMM